MSECVYLRFERMRFERFAGIVENCLTILTFHLFSMKIA